MKFPIATASLLLLLGTAASIDARQDKGRDEHSEQSKPEQQHSAPKQQQKRPSPAQHQQAPNARPAQQTHTQPTAHPQQQAAPEKQQQARSAKPAQQLHTQQANLVSRPQQGNAQQTQARTVQPHSSGGDRNASASAHGRISNAHYASSFGSGHSFHVSQGDYGHRRFQYGGYSFGFIDPWPVGWGYSDDVYVVYADGGYYMYDRVHPGIRISINLF